MVREGAASAEAVISTARLTKYYGDHPGLLDLDLEVASGEIFGYLGPNGAGKTTTIRLLLDLIRPTSGEATVLGLDVSSDSIEIRKQVGYLPGEFSLYERMTTQEMIAYFGALRSSTDLSYARELAELLELELDRPIKELSRGNKQKAGLLQAVMHRPRLLILDEPTSGLDPFVQRKVYGLLRQLRDDGGTVFLSSHLLHEVEQVADRIGVINGGRLMAVEKIQDLKAKAVHEVEVHFGSEVSAAELSGIPNVEAVHVDGGVARFKVKGSVDALIKALAAHEVVNVIAQEADLEEIFFAYYEKAQ